MLGRSFTVDVSEPKPNRSNTMNLVKKWTQELGLSEGFFNRSDRIVREWNCQRRGGGVNAYPRVVSEDEFFFFSILRCFTVRAFQESSKLRSPPPLVRPLLLYILLLHSSWPSICWSYRSLLEYLSHPALSSTCCELQQTRWYYSGVIPSLMRLDCQLRAFNAEVTDSSIISPPPCPYSCLPMLVLSFGMTRRAALDGVLLFPSMTSVRRGQDGPRRCLPAALGLP